MGTRVGILKSDNPFDTGWWSRKGIICQIVKPNTKLKKHFFTCMDTRRSCLGKLLRSVHHRAKELRRRRNSDSFRRRLRYRNCSCPWPWSPRRSGLDFQNWKINSWIKLWQLTLHFNKEISTKEQQMTKVKNKTTQNKSFLLILNSIQKFGNVLKDLLLVVFKKRF